MISMIAIEMARKVPVLLYVAIKIMSMTLILFVPTFYLDWRQGRYWKFSTLSILVALLYLYFFLQATYESQRESLCVYHQSHDHEYEYDQDQDQSQPAELTWLLNWRLFQFNSPVDCMLNRWLMVSSFIFIGMRVVDLYFLHGRKRHERNLIHFCRSFVIMDKPTHQKRDENEEDHSHDDDHVRWKDELEKRIGLAKVWRGFVIPWTSLSPAIIVLIAVTLEGIFQSILGQIFFTTIYIPLMHRVRAHETWSPYLPLILNNSSNNGGFAGVLDQFAFSLAFAMMLYLFINTLFKLMFLNLAFIMKGYYRGAFNRIWFSTSVKQFWRSRWNLFYQECFYRIIGVVINTNSKSKYKSEEKESRSSSTHMTGKSLSIVILTFLFSGLMHDWLVWNGMNVRYEERTFEMTVFFMLQAVGVIFEETVLFHQGLIKRHSWGARIWTYFFLLLTSPLFIRPFLLNTVTSPMPFEVIFIR